MVLRSRAIQPPRPMRQDWVTQPVEHWVLRRFDSWPSRAEHCRQSRGGPRAIQLALLLTLRLK